MDRVFAFLIIVVLAIIIFVKLSSPNPSPAPATPASGTSAPAAQVPAPPALTPVAQAAAPRAPTPAAQGAANRVAPAAGRSAQQPPQAWAAPAPPAGPGTSCLDDIRRVCKKHNVTIIKMTPQGDRVDLTIKGHSRQDLSYILDDLLYDLHILKDVNNEDMKYWERMENGGIAYYAIYKMRVSK